MVLYLDTLTLHEERLQVKIGWGSLNPSHGEEAGVLQTLPPTLLLFMSTYSYRLF